MSMFTFTQDQNVPAGQSVMFNNVICCNKGYVLHENGSSVVTLRGIVNNRCADRARYLVVFTGNIAIPEGGTVAPISVAIAKVGEAQLASQAISTPAAVEQFNNVTSRYIIDVPRGCCSYVSIENTSAEAITVANAVLTIDRIA